MDIKEQIKDRLLAARENPQNRGSAGKGTEINRDVTVKALDAAAKRQEHQDMHHPSMTEKIAGGLKRAIRGVQATVYGPGTAFQLYPGWNASMRERNPKTGGAWWEA